MKRRSLVVWPAALLTAFAALSTASQDETERFQFNLDSAREAIRVIERELDGFDGASPPSEPLREAESALRNQMSILRDNADRHTLAPPGLGGIITRCRGIEQSNPYQSQLDALKQESERQVDAFRIHTRAFLQTRRALNQLVAGKSLELWLSVMPLDTGATLLQLADSLVGVFAAQEGFPAGAYVERHRAVLARRSEARAKASGLTPDSPRIGFVFAAYSELALLAKENYEIAERRVAAIEANRRAMEARAAAFANTKASYLAVCDRVTSLSGWQPRAPAPTPTPTPPPTPPPAVPPPGAGPPSAPGAVEVPHITGWDRENAESEIRAAGLAVGSVTQRASSHVPEGSVIDQSPAGGTHVASGTAIALFLSRGPSLPGQLIVEPDSVDLEIGETAEFAARVVYDDGSIGYLTYGSTWTPGPDHKFTATRQGTYTVTATFEGLTGQAVVRVAGREFTRPVLPPPGTSLPPAAPGDYTWYALCRPADGQVTFGQRGSYNAVTQRILGGPFAGPRSAQSWIDGACPTWRCTSSGVCAQGPSPGDGVGDWFVMCNPQSRAVGLSRGSHAPGQRVMAGPFLGEPEARSWTSTECPSWLCEADGRCAASATTGGSGGSGTAGPARGDPATDSASSGSWQSGPVETTGPTQPSRGSFRTGDGALIHPSFGEDDEATATTLKASNFSQNLRRIMGDAVRTIQGETPASWSSMTVHAFLLQSLTPDADVRELVKQVGWSNPRQERTSTGTVVIRLGRRSFQTDSGKAMKQAVMEFQYRGEFMGYVSAISADYDFPTLTTEVRRLLAPSLELIDRRFPPRQP